MKFMFVLKKGKEMEVEITYQFSQAFERLGTNRLERYILGEKIAMRIGWTLSLFCGVFLETGKVCSSKKN